MKHKNEPFKGCPDVPCTVIPHYLSDDQIICEVPRIQLNGVCGAYQVWKITVKN